MMISTRHLASLTCNKHTESKKVEVSRCIVGVQSSDNIRKHELTLTSPSVFKMVVCYWFGQSVQ